MSLYQVQTQLLSPRQSFDSHLVLVPRKKLGKTKLQPKRPTQATTENASRADPAQAQEFFVLLYFRPNKHANNVPSWKTDTITTRNLTQQLPCQLLGGQKHHIKIKYDYRASIIHCTLPVDYYYNENKNKNQCQRQQRHLLQLFEQVQCTPLVQRSKGSWAQLCRTAASMDTITPPITARLFLF